MMDLRLHILSAALLSLLLTVVAGRLLLPVLYKRRAAQPILEIGPAWHLSKKGTPTLGGLFFIIGVSATLLLYAAVTGGDTAASLCLLLAFALLSGAIGLLDDICKLTKRENQGLSAAQKYFLQLFVAALFLLIARMRGIVDTSIALPLVQSPVSLGVLYYPLMLLYLTGLENALNLTDGLDGLLGTTAAVMGACFILLGLLTGAQLLLVTGAALLGGMLGFLVFNHHPAKVFMGDTGSLFLGALVAGAGLLVRLPATVLLAGGVFVFEAATVMLQVGYFKLTHGKRLFLMAPYHHTLEKRGLSENTVVLVFGLAALLLAALALLSL